MSESYQMLYEESQREIAALRQSLAAAEERVKEVEKERDEPKQDFPGQVKLTARDIRRILIAAAGREYEIPANCAVFVHLTPATYNVAATLELVEMSEAGEGRNES